MGQTRRLSRSFSFADQRARHSGQRSRTAPQHSSRCPPPTGGSRPSASPRARPARRRWRSRGTARRRPTSNPGALPEVSGQPMRSSRASFESPSPSFGVAVKPPSARCTRYPCAHPATGPTRRRCKDWEREPGSAGRRRREARRREPCSRRVSSARPMASAVPYAGRRSKPPALRTQEHALAQVVSPGRVRRCQSVSLPRHRPL